MAKKIEMPLLTYGDTNVRKYMNGVEVHYDHEANTAEVIWEDYYAEYELTDEQGIKDEILFLSQFLAGDGSFDSAKFDKWFEEQQKLISKV